ncbi:MAG: cytochrome c [Mesorhizobium sp.]|nr:cytochrome c [Mesorhizobium sp.]
MRLALFAATILALTMSGAGADIIDDRQANMKERGDVMRILGPIAQGQQPFDAEVVLAALERLNENALGENIMEYFPEGSETGGDTRAAPAIWEDTETFVRIESTYATNVQAAVDAGPEDLDGFRAAFGPVAAQCGACHERFRTQQ